LTSSTRRFFTLQSSEAYGAIGLARGRKSPPLGNPARDTGPPRRWKRQHFGRLVSRGGPELADMVKV
jgi:hypothetical protein